jgi:hypothetical protein
LPAVNIDSPEINRNFIKKVVIFLNISSIKFQHKKGLVVQTSKNSIVNKFIKKDRNIQIVDTCFKKA